MISVRVYGILINENNQVLVSDEYIRGNYFTKFPGGGMELGEGTRDCLRREFMEETGLDVTVGEHIYLGNKDGKSDGYRNRQYLPVGNLYF